MNNDVLIEILSRLPVQSLFRFRAVCKFWGDVIDSPSFRKLHTHNNNSNKSDDAVSLHVTYSIDDDGITATNRVQKKKLSIKLEHNDRSLMSCESNRSNGFWLSNWNLSRIARLFGAVKGLICINCYSDFEVPLAICNPFLGQLKILPLSTSSLSNSSCGITLRNVAIGFDEDDYKVVQLLLCREHLLGFHAQLYSRRKNSWRELAGVLDDLDIGWISPIESFCKNGYFAHWLVSEIYSSKRIILSFDMKNEEFRTITLAYSHKGLNKIFAEDEHSFLNIAFASTYPFERDTLVGIYESRCEGSVLSWNHVTNVTVPFTELRADSVVFSNIVMASFFEHWRNEFVECRGSFVLP